MNRLLLLQEFAKIGKGFLRRISKCRITYSEIVLDPSSNELIEVKRYTRLSWFQILQLLLYHFCQVEQETGIIRNLSEKELADTLHCTVKTIRKNNELFVKYQLISYSHASNHTINVQLLEYPEYILEGGSGYLYLPWITFCDYLNLNNVNGLRLALQSYLDDNNHFKEKPNTVHDLSFQAVRDFLPDYIKGKKAIKNIIPLHAASLKAEIVGDKIQYKVPEEFNSKYLRKLKTEIYTEHFEWVTGNFNKDIVKVSDLVQMSFQYGFRIVKAVVENIITSFTQAEMINFGGLVRDYIVNNRPLVA